LTQNIHAKNNHNIVFQETRPTFSRREAKIAETVTITLDPGRKSYRGYI
jgi:hypothetical protein